MWWAVSSFFWPTEILARYQAAYEDSGSETELKKQQNGDRKLLSKLIMTSANIDEE